MSAITIKADRISQVHISDGQWDLALEKALDGRSRAAFIVSERIASQVNFEIESDTDIHIFTIPDGEEGKSTATLLKLWDWLGAAGFTRSDIIIGIGGEQPLILLDSLPQPGCVELIGLQCQQVLPAWSMLPSGVRLA